MTRTSALAGTAIFLALAPGVVAGLVPWWISRWRLAAQTPLSQAFALFGWALVAVGVVALAESFLRFALEGRGTPAPPLPTRRLIVSGLYRFVRNPMYLAVVAVILGQALVFGSRDLLIYAAGIWLAMHAFVVAYEEPKLRRAFPEDYAAYGRQVRRWLPRLRPYDPVVVSGAARPRG